MSENISLLNEKSKLGNQPVRQKIQFCKCLKRNHRRHGDFYPVPQDKIEAYKQQRAIHNWELIKRWVKVMHFEKQLKHFVTKKFEKESRGIDVDINLNSKTKKNFWQRIRSHFYLVPNGVFNGIWDMITNTIVIASLIITPLVMSFDFYSDTMSIFDTLFDVILAIDIIVNFFTAYWSDIDLVIDNKQIALHYLSHYFIFDCVSTLPTLFSFQNYYVYALKLFRYVKFPAVIEHIRITSQIFLSSVIGLNQEIVHYFVKFFRLILILILFTHIFACIWAYFGRTYDDGWYYSGTDEDLDQPSMYILCYYWVVTTLTSVGYGDYSGKNTNEYLFQILLLFCGMAFFSMNIGTMALHLQQNPTFEEIVEQKKEDLELWLFRLDKLNKEKQLPHELYSDIHRFLANSFKHDFNLVIEDYDFFFFLPPRLQNQLSLNLFGDFVEKFGFFFEGTQKSFKSMFLVNLFFKEVGPLLPMISQGEPVTEIYFILKGEVKMMANGFDMTFDEGSYFGEIQVLLNLNSTVDISSSTETVKCMCMSKKVFLELCEQYPPSAEILKQRAAQRRRLLRQHKKRIQNRNSNNARRRTLSPINRKGTQTSANELDELMHHKEKENESPLTTEEEEPDNEPEPNEDSFSEDEIINPSRNERVEMKMKTSALKKIRVIEKKVQKLNRAFKNFDESILQNFKLLFDYLKNPNENEKPNFKKLMKKPGVTKTIIQGFSNPKMFGSTNLGKRKLPEISKEGSEASTPIKFSSQLMANENPDVGQLSINRDHSVHGVIPDSTIFVAKQVDYKE